MEDVLFGEQVLRGSKWWIVCPIRYGHSDSELIEEEESLERVEGISLPLRGVEMTR